MITEQNGVIALHNPSSDIFNGSPGGDVVHMAEAERCSIMFYHAGGTSGNGKLTIDACDDVTPSNTSAIGFRYRKKTTGASDTWGAVTAVAAATGVTTVGGESTIYELEFRAQDLPAGYPYFRLKLAEVTNDPVTGCAFAILRNRRYGGITQPTALT